MRRGLAFALAASAALIVAASCEHSTDSRPPAWNETIRASCWDGPNAERRMMNVLSPLMDEATFEARLRFMRERGANTAHVFLVNRANGECSGYSPWGIGVGPCVNAPNEEVCAWMRRRIKRLRASGLAVVVWIQADDSAAWARDLALMAPDCLAAIANAGLLDEASAVVAGLEMDEYWSAGEAAAVVRAIRAVWGGVVGTHHTAGRAAFAPLGDVLYWQTAPGASPAQAADETRRALSHGRPVCFFECARHPSRAACEAALAAGAFAVGNW